MDPEEEIRIAPHKNGLPLCDPKEITYNDLHFVVDQYLTKDSYCCIAVNVTTEFPFNKEKIFIPDLEVDKNYIINNENQWWNNEFKGKKVISFNGNYYLSLKDCQEIVKELEKK